VDGDFTGSDRPGSGNNNRSRNGYRPFDGRVTRSAVVSSCLPDLAWGGIMAAGARWWRDGGVMGDRRVRAYVGLGANVGDARTTLVRAVRALEALPGARVRGVSRLYVTRPVGVLDQPDFHNAVVALDVPLGSSPETGALALLVALKRLEAAFGRQGRGRWGPRELDLDLLVFGRHPIHVERPDAARSADPARTGVQWLEVPHASAQARLFVLAPLADLVPGLVPPGWPASVATLRDRLLRSEPPDAIRAVGAWRSLAEGWGYS
jgi:2-amino-4-hydroxy-6-hydroxymethyldihydropteridine diphosphokinase